MAVGIEEEDLHVAVAAGHRATFERDAVLREAGAGRVEVVHLEREVVRHPALLPGTRVGLPGAARGVRIGEEVDLGAAEPEPRAVEREVRPAEAPPRARAARRRTRASGRGRRRRARRAGSASPRLLP